MTRYELARALIPALEAVRAGDSIETPSRSALDVGRGARAKPEHIAAVFAALCPLLAPERPPPTLTREAVVNRLSTMMIEWSGDQEMAHIKADELVAAFLRQLGYDDVAAAFDRVPKWYS